jgi:hypothetical protein
MKAGTRVIFAGDQGDELADKVREITTGMTAADLAGDEAGAATTVYFLADGKVSTGDKLSSRELKSLPAGTKVIVGYVSGGSITSRRSAFDLCGVSWNLPSTYYRFPDGRLLTGDAIRENAIPAGTLVFIQN